jgi:hypothetical protein
VKSLKIFGCPAYLADVQGPIQNQMPFQRTRRKVYRETLKGTVPSAMKHWLEMMANLENRLCFARLVATMCTVIASRDGAAVNGAQEAE